MSAENNIVNTLNFAIKTAIYAFTVIAVVMWGRDNVTVNGMFAVTGLTDSMGVVMPSLVMIAFLTHSNMAKRITFNAFMINLIGTLYCGLFIAANNHLPMWLVFHFYLALAAMILFYWSKFRWMGNFARAGDSYRGTRGYQNVNSLRQYGSSTPSPSASSGPAAGGNGYDNVNSLRNNRSDDSNPSISRANFVNKAVMPRYSFRDVVGMDDIKALLSKIGREIKDGSSPEPRNGVLLNGDPGNGKTFIAEAFAGEMNLPIIKATFGGVVSKWVGETTEKLMAVFDDAESQAPCVLFIDEFDSLLINREGVTSPDSEGPKTVDAVLTRLIDIRGKGIVVIAATNFVDRLDKGGIRDGRFDYKIAIPPPDFRARKGLLLRKFAGAGITHVDMKGVDRAAQRWEGFSVARIRGIADESVEMLRENTVDRIDFDSLMKALRNVQGKMGTRLPENAKGLNELCMSGKMKDQLGAIASRMIDIEETEMLGGSVPSGLLFYGPPGTGKSATAIALAKDTKWAFISTSGQSLMSESKEIDRIFKLASDMRPCIVFIDEADDILADRAQSHQYYKANTNKLIQMMEGAAGRMKDVLFIAATNHPQMMDGGAMRGGRFTEKVKFELPDVRMIQSYVSDWMANCQVGFGKDFTAHKAACLLDGEPFANVKEMLQGAINNMIARRARSGGFAEITMADLENAKQVVASNF